MSQASTPPGWYPDPSGANRATGAPLREKRPRARIYAAAITAVLAFVAVVAAVIMSNSNDSASDDSASSSTPSPTLPNTGPLTGTFRVEFGPGTNPADGTPWDNVLPITDTWTLRSSCTPECVATASTGNQYPANGPIRELVFDDVGGRWLAATVVQAKCKNVDAEQWVAISIAPQPDGSLAGDAMTLTANVCGTNRTIKLSRIGDADISVLPDPATVGPRTSSPAEALHGSYHLTAEYDSGRRDEYDYRVRTDCLRTGDRCISLFATPESLLAYVFGNGVWTTNTAFKGKCAKSGESADITVTGTLVLPDPPQHPITELIGQSHLESTCSDPTSEMTDKFTRTGD